MKVKVNSWRIIWRFLLAMLAILIVTFMAAFNIFFNYQVDPFSISWAAWDYRQPLLIGIVLGVSIIGFIPALTSYYYIIEDKYFVMKKYGKEYEFSYANIEFIDIEESKRKKMVIFYTPKSKMRFLLADKDNKLLETLIKKCKNNMSVEEFRRRHPEEKY